MNQCAAFGFSAAGVEVRFHSVLKYSALQLIIVSFHDIHSTEKNAVSGHH